MNALVMWVVFLDVPGWTGVGALDTTGTTGCEIRTVRGAVWEKQGPAKAGPKETERAGHS